MTRLSPRRRTRRLGVAAILVGLVAAPLVTATPAQAATPVTLNLLGINDFHGRIDANTVKWAGTVEQLRAAGGAANTLFVSAGDNISASLFASSVQQDQPTIDVLNALGLNASAVGNHEFDKGFADLTDRVIAGGTNARWDYLGANVYRKGTTTPALDAYHVYVVDGLRIGVIGAVTQEAPSLVSPAGVATLDFGEPVAAVNAVANQLTDSDPANGEADVLVATFHEGASEGTPDGATLEEEVAQGGAFARIVNDLSPKVAAVFTGHTHKAYAWDAPVPGRAGTTRPIIQTGDYGSNVGQVKLTVDPATHAVSSYTVANVPRVTTDDSSLISQYDRVSKVNDIVQAALKYGAEQGNKPVGQISADITTAFSGGGRDDRSSESTLGDLVADVLRDRLGDSDFGGAEIGVVNPGGLRAELLFAGDTTSNPANTDGVVTFAEANAVLPFVNNLWTTSLTGAQLVTLLEQQWQRLPDGKPAVRPYLQLGLSRNVTYTYHEVDDPANAGFKKGVIDSVIVNGLPLDLAKSYRIGTFSFLTAGGDNFRVFTAGTNAKDSGFVDRDAWIDYLMSHKPITPDFARQSVVVSNQPTTVNAGDSVTFGLSKLDLTSLGSPSNTTVALSAVAEGGSTTPLGSFPVTNGAAQLTFTAPAGGTYALVAKVTPSNTTVTIPLVVKTVTGPPAVEVTATAVVKAAAERVNVRVTAKNVDTVAVDIRFTTPWGATVKFAQVAPGATVKKTFATGRGSVPAGVVKVATYKRVDGKGYYRVYDAPYTAAQATVNPRGHVEADTQKKKGKVVLRGYFLNLGGDPVKVYLRTAYGRSVTKSVRPFHAVYLRVATGDKKTKATTGTIVARKTVDAKRYRSEFVVTFKAR